uniref:Chromo domain-containing protein n=1 Tax=Tanacetum cinerariifolium TaxID=118510 RepID=A0A6L2KZW4_TANCI|nr:hypothetical protein [Tanacetum cinerariifolium]
MHDTSSSSGNYITHVVDENIRPVNDQVPFSEVDSNTSPGSTNMSHTGGDIDRMLNMIKEESFRVGSPASYKMMKEWHEQVDMAQASLDKATKRMKKWADERSRHVEFEVGDQVMVKLLPQQFKSLRKVHKGLIQRYEGPFLVIGHVGKVEEILSDRTIQRRGVLSYKEYLIKWRDLPDSEASWEAKDLLCRCMLDLKSSERVMDKSKMECSRCMLGPITPHYVPNVRESVFVKPHHVIASGSSRNSSNESYGSNDMAHKYYLEIAIGQRFSLNKSFAVREKLNAPRSCLRWIPTGRIFKTAGLRWIPTRNMFTDSTTKVDSETPNGSNEDITNPYECKQSLDVSTCTLNINAAQASNLNVNKMASTDNTSGVALQRKESLGLVQNSVSPTPYVSPSKKDYEILFQQLFDLYFNPPLRVVSLVLVVVAAPRAVDPAGSLSSTTIDQDEPFASSSPTTQEIQSQVTHQGAKEQIHRHQNA